MTAHLRRVSTTLFVLAFALATGAALAACLDARPGGDGSLRVSGDLDLGAVDRGSDCAFVLTVRNGRERDLDIARVTSTCGCTGIDYDAATLAPGRTLRITGHIDTSVPGRRRSTIYLWEEGISEPLRVGTVEARVRAGWRPAERDAIVRLDRGSGRLAREVRLTSDDVMAPTTVSCTTDLEFLGARADLNGRILTVTFDAGSGAMPLGRFGATLVVRSDSRAAPEYHERVVVEHQADRVRTRPAEVITPLDTTGRHSLLSFVLFVDAAPVAVREVRALDERIARIESWKQADDGRLELKIESGKHLQHTTRARILLHTDVAPVIVEVVVTAAPES